jgi:hypothetical protein
MSNLKGLLEEQKQLRIKAHMLKVGIGTKARLNQLRMFR